MPLAGIVDDVGNLRNLSITLRVSNLGIISLEQARKMKRKAIKPLSERFGELCNTYNHAILKENLNMATRIEEIGQMHQAEHNHTQADLIVEKPGQEVAKECVTSSEPGLEVGNECVTLIEPGPEVGNECVTSATNAMLVCKTVSF